MRKIFKLELIDAPGIKDNKFVVVTMENYTKSKSAMDVAMVLGQGEYEEVDTSNEATLRISKLPLNEDFVKVYLMLGAMELAILVDHFRRNTHANQGSTKLE